MEGYQSNLDGKLTSLRKPDTEDVEVVNDDNCEADKCEPG